MAERKETTFFFFFTLELYLEYRLQLDELGIKGKRKRKSFFFFFSNVILSRTSFAQADEQVRIKVEEETRIRSFIVGDGIEDKSTTTTVRDSCIHVSNRSHFSRQITRSGGKRIREVWAIEPSYQQSTMSDRSVDDCRPAPLPISPTDMSHFPWRKSSRCFVPLESL